MDGIMDGRMERTVISPTDMFDLYKSDPELIANADEYGFERRPCVEIRGVNDYQIAVIFPRNPWMWAREFNALVEKWRAMRSRCTCPEYTGEDWDCPVHGEDEDVTAN